MFDVGFSELVLLFIIGLLVLGPEKLPQVANKIGGWVGQARRMTRMLKRQIEEELEISKVRETVNQPLSSMLNKPAARPKPRSYEEGEDDESGFGETGHRDAEDSSPHDEPAARPDPAAPAPPGESTAAGTDAELPTKKGSERASS